MHRTCIIVVTGRHALAGLAARLNYSRDARLEVESRLIVSSSLPLLAQLSSTVTDIGRCSYTLDRLRATPDFGLFRILIPLSRRVRFDFRDLSMFCIIYTIPYLTAQLPIQLIISFYRLKKLWNILLSIILAKRIVKFRPKLVKNRQ